MRRRHGAVSSKTTTRSGETTRPLGSHCTRRRVGTGLDSDCFSRAEPDPCSALAAVDSWALFTKDVLANMHDLSKFKPTDWMQEIGLPWSNATNTFPTEPEGDTVEIASELFAKYVRAK